jgi:hypothetical protein
MIAEQGVHEKIFMRGVDRRKERRYNQYLGRILWSMAGDAFGPLVEVLTHNVSSRKKTKGARRVRPTRIAFSFGGASAQRQH